MSLIIPESCDLPRLDPAKAEALGCWPYQFEIPDPTPPNWFNMAKVSAEYYCTGYGHELLGYDIATGKEKYPLRFWIRPLPLRNRAIKQLREIPRELLGSAIGICATILWIWILLIPIFLIAGLVARILGK